MTDRRTFLVAAGATAAASALPIGASPVSNYPKLVHHVFFWLKNPNSKEDLEKLLKGLRTLAKIETVRGVHFGVPASTEKRDVVDNSYSASEILFFDDTAGQKAHFGRRVAPRNLRPLVVALVMALGLGVLGVACSRTVEECTPRTVQTETGAVTTTDQVCVRRSVFGGGGGGLGK